MADLKKGDFVEIEFTAQIKDTGEVFDSNIKEDIEKSNPSLSPERVAQQAKTFIFPLGESFFLKGVEDFLIGKTCEKFPQEYKIDLASENAFGKRDTKLIQRIPFRIFKEQKINPFPGAMFNFDGRIGKVLASSGGRVIVDFNNPVAGKDVIYDLKVLKKIEDINKKIKSLMEFFYRKEFDFDLDEKNKKLKIKLKPEEQQYKQFAEIFKDKFKSILDLELDVEVAGENSGKAESEDKKLIT